MADEHDGIDEALEGMLRIGLTAAGRVAEVAARAREQAERDARAASEAQARELAQRLQAERAAARAQLAPVDRTDWWHQARPEDIAQVWETARSWQHLDPVAERAAGRIRREVADRYGIDIDAPGGDPATVRDALARRGIAERDTGAQRSTADAEDAEDAEDAAAARLLAAADRADRQQQPKPAAAARAAGEDRGDTSDRRRPPADALTGGVAAAEAVAARVTADTIYPRPAAEAVRRPPPAAPQARSGVPAASRRRQRTPGLGR